MLRTISTLFVLAACQRDERRQLRRPPNWYQNLGPAARSEYASEVPSAEYCEEQAARRVAWETERLRRLVRPPSFVSSAIVGWSLCMTSPQRRGSELLWGCPDEALRAAPTFARVFDDGFHDPYKVAV